MSRASRSITPADIEAADDLGYRIKLLGVALRTESGIEQRVHPTMVPKHTAIAEVDGVLNCVAVDGDFVGDVMLIGRGAGGAATASAVTSDLIDIARGHILPPFGITGEGPEALQEGADARARGRLLHPALGLRPHRRLCGDRQPHGRAGHLASRASCSAAPRAELPGFNRRHKGLAGRRGHDHPSDHRGRDPQGAWRPSSATVMSMQKPQMIRIEKL